MVYENNKMISTFSNEAVLEKNEEISDELEIIWKSAPNDTESHDFHFDFKESEAFFLSETFIESFRLFLECYQKSNLSKKQNPPVTKHFVKLFFKQLKIYPILFDVESFDNYFFDQHLTKFLIENPPVTNYKDKPCVYFWFAVHFCAYTFIKIPLNKPAVAKINLLYKKMKESEPSFRMGEISVPLSTQKEKSNNNRVISIKTKLKNKSDVFSKKEIKKLQIFFEDICFLFNDLPFKVKNDKFRLILAKSGFINSFIKNNQTDYVDSASFIKLVHSTEADSNLLVGYEILNQIQKKKYLIDKENTKNELISLLVRFYESDLYLNKKSQLRDFTFGTFRKSRDGVVVTYDSFIKYIKTSKLLAFLSINSLKLYFKIAFDFMYVKYNPYDKINKNLFLDMEGFEHLIQILEIVIRKSEKQFSESDIFLTKLL